MTKSTCSQWMKCQWHYYKHKRSQWQSTPMWTMTLSECDLRSGHCQSSRCWKASLGLRPVQSTWIINAIEQILQTSWRLLETNFAWDWDLHGAPDQVLNTVPVFSCHELSIPGMMQPWSCRPQCSNSAKSSPERLCWQSEIRHLWVSD